MASNSINSSITNDASYISSGVSRAPNSLKDEPHEQSLAGMVDYLMDHAIEQDLKLEELFANERRRNEEARKRAQMQASNPPSQPSTITIPANWKLRLTAALAYLAAFPAGHSWSFDKNRDFLRGMYEEVKVLYLLRESDALKISALVANLEIELMTFEGNPACGRRCVEAVELGIKHLKCIVNFQ